MEESGRMHRTLKAPSSDETLEGSKPLGRAPDEAPLRRGEPVGRYVVLEAIGRGAMGVVYKAFDPQLDRAVALKRLLAGGTARAHDLMEEARAIAKVSHPNVIAVHDVGEHQGRVFFAMELVDGLPLSRWRSETAPTPAQLLDVFRQAGAGLAAAHDAGIVHRDFKPENVLVGADGRVRVLDFGLARNASRSHVTTDEGDLARTHAGTLVGTPAYMSPEQLGGAPADARSDQFAFCVALHEALTGMRPFAGDTVAALSYAVLQGERTPASLEHVPARIVGLLDRGLATDPALRFPSMHTLLEALAPEVPLRWGRLGFAGAAVLVVVTATAYGLGRSSTTPSDPCVDASGELETLWTDVRRGEIEGAFLGSGAYNAASMGQRVLTSLDDYAHRWTEAAARSCTMIEVEHVLDPELAFRSAHCIDAAREAFEVSLEGLQALDSDAVQSSLDTVDDLPSPEDCLDRALLELRVEVPSDPELRASVVDLIDDLEAEAELTLGQPAECLERLEPLARRARDIGHRPMLAKLLEQRAACLFESGQEKEGQTTLHRAFEASLATGHDALAMQVAAEIAHVVATRTEDFERAETWILQAEALAQRHGIESGKVMRGVLNVRGILAARQGDTEAATALFQQLADATRDRPSTAGDHAAAHANIGVVLANAGRPDQALAYFERAAEISEAHWGPEHLRTAIERTKVGQTRYLLGDFEEARDTLKAALDIITKTTPLNLDVAISTHTIAAAERRLGNADEALRLGREAYDMRVRLGVIDGLNSIDLLAFLAEVERQAGNEAEADAMLAKQLDNAEAQGLPVDVALALGRVAAAHLAKGERDEARRVMDRAEALVVSSDEKRGPGLLGSTLYELGALLLRLGETSRGLALCRRAEALVRAQPAANIWGSTERRLRFARVLAEEALFDEARAVLDGVDAVLADRPYPSEAVEGAKALRERLKG